MRRTFTVLLGLRDRPHATCARFRSVSGATSLGKIQTEHPFCAVKYWEIIADKLTKTGWSLGWVSAVDSRGRTLWITDAHRDAGKRFVVHADEKLTAFLELERAICIDLLSENLEK